MSESSPTPRHRTAGDLVTGTRATLARLGRMLAATLRRDRHRLALATVAAALAGYLLYAPFTAQVAGLPFPVFAALVSSGVVLVAAVLTALLFPGARRLIECMALSRLAVALFISLTPVPNIWYATSPGIGATVVVLGAFTIYHALYGRLAFAMTPVRLRHRLGRLLDDQAAPAR